DIQMLSGKSSRKIDSEGDPPRLMSRFGASSTPRLSAIKELRDVESNCASIFFGVGPAAGKPETVEDATKADYVYCGKNKKGKKYCVFGYRQPREQPDLPVSQLHVRPYVVRRVPVDKEEPEARQGWLEGEGHMHLGYWSRRVVLVKWYTSVVCDKKGTSSRKQDPRRVLVGRQLIQTLGVKVLMPSAWLNYEEKKTTLGDLL
ncbi:hypothetical protein FOZ63_015131, partial [Perkinsus olseni]